MRTAIGITTSGQTTSFRGGVGLSISKMVRLNSFPAWDIVAVEDLDKRNPDHIWNIVDRNSMPFLGWEPTIVKPKIAIIESEALLINRPLGLSMKRTYRQGCAVVCTIARGRKVALILHPPDPFRFEDVSKDFYAMMVESDFGTEDMISEFECEVLPLLFWIEEVG